MRDKDSVTVVIPVVDIGVNRVLIWDLNTNLRTSAILTLGRSLVAIIWQGTLRIRGAGDPDPANSLATMIGGGSITALNHTLRPATVMQELAMGASPSTQILSLGSGWLIGPLGSTAVLGVSDRTASSPTVVANLRQSNTAHKEKTKGDQNRAPA